MLTADHGGNSAVPTDIKVSIGQAEDRSVQDIIHQNNELSQYQWELQQIDQEGIDDTDIDNRVDQAYEKRKAQIERMNTTQAQSQERVKKLLEEAQKDAEEAGMSALLAVGRGSPAPPRLVVVEHAPDGAEGH